MNEDTLLSAAVREIDRASEYLQSEIASNRAKSYDYYWGKPFGNEVDGRSKLVTRDVQIFIDSVLPSLIKTFIGSDAAVSFTPRGPEDVEKAEQQTEVANYVFQTWNEGYQLTHDCLKDGLLQKTGIFKWWWEPETKVSEKLLQGLGTDQLQQLVDSPQHEITAHSQYTLNHPIAGPVDVHDVQVRETKQSGKIKVCVVPPEEFLISPNATSMYAEDAPCIGHVTLKTYSELIEMGIDAKVLEEVGGSTESSDFDTVKNARRDRSANFNLSTQDEEAVDPARRTYRYYELYMKVDFDGDGVAETRRVCLINRTKITHNEPTDHVPLAWWSPKIMPHEPIGMSVADDLMDLQFARSTFLRGAADNVYLTNAPRIYANEDMEVNIEDLLTVRPGGVIRGKGPAGEALQPITIPFVAGETFQMTEMLAQEGEQRSGISRFAQGIDPNSINKTATHASIVNQATQMRTELYARNFAEYAFKPMFKGIQYLLAQNQTEALITRLRGKAIPVEPDVWKTEYDMTCNVGLGTGNKDQQLMHLQSMTQDVMMAAQSPFGPYLVDEQKFFNLFKKKSELAGFKEATEFMNDPTQIDPQKRQQIEQSKHQPPPEIQKAQMEIQANQQVAQAKMQSDQQQAMQKMQADNQQKQVELAASQQLEHFKAQLSAQIEQAKQAFQAQQVQHQNNLEAQRQQMQAHFDAQVETMRQQFALQIARENNQTKREIAELSAATTLNAAQVQAAKAADGGSNAVRD